MLEYIEEDIGVSTFDLSHQRNSLYESQDVKNIYKQLDTIDWLNESTDSNRRIALARETYTSATFPQKIKILIGYSTGWLLAFVVGSLIGVIGFMIRVGTEWMSDLKHGFCKTDFFLNRQNCCWQETTHLTINQTCDNWFSYWHEIIGNDWTSMNHAIAILVLFTLGLGFASLSAIFTRDLAPYAANSGFTEVKTILSGFIMHGFFGIGTMFVKLFSVILSSSSGLVTSYEEGIVHIGGCVSNIFARFFTIYTSNEVKKREILSAGVAASIAVAFNAPIGGLLLTLEELGYFFCFKTFWRAFFCAVTSVFMFSLFPLCEQFSNFNTITYLSIYHIISFAIVASFNGVFGAIFVTVASRWSKSRRLSFISYYPIIEVLVITAFSLGSSFILGFRFSDRQILHHLFSSCNLFQNSNIFCVYTGTENSTIKSSSFQTKDADAMWWNIIAIICFGWLVKMILCVFTMSAKLPVGFFLPCMVIGGLIGRLVGIILEYLLFYIDDSWKNHFCPKSIEECVEPAIFAIVGAISFISSVTQMSVTLVVVMAEATGTMTHIIPLMIGVLFAKYFRNFITKDSIFQKQINLNRYPFLPEDYRCEHEGKVEDILVYISNNLVDTSNIVCLWDTKTTHGEMIQILQSTTYHGFPVLSNQGELLGYVNRSDLLNHIQFLRNSYMDTINFESKIIFKSYSVSDTSTIGEVDDDSYNFSDLVSEHPNVVLSDTSIFVLLEMFKSLGLRLVLVVKNSSLIGIITRKDLLKFLNGY